MYQVNIKSQSQYEEEGFGLGCGKASKEGKLGILIMAVASL